MTCWVLVMAAIQPTRRSSRPWRTPSPSVNGMMVNPCPTVALTSSAMPRDQVAPHQVPPKDQTCDCFQGCWPWSWALITRDFQPERFDGFSTMACSSIFSTPLGEYLNALWWSHKRPGGNCCWGKSFAEVCQRELWCWTLLRASWATGSTTDDHCLWREFLFAIDGSSQGGNFAWEGRQKELESSTKTRTHSKNVKKPKYDTKPENEEIPHNHLTPADGDLMAELYADEERSRWMKRMTLLRMTWPNRMPRFPWMSATLSLCSCQRPARSHGAVVNVPTVFQKFVFKTPAFLAALIGLENSPLAQGPDVCITPGFSSAGTGSNNYLNWFLLTFFSGTGDFGPTLVCSATISSSNWRTRPSVTCLETADCFAGAGPGPKADKWPWKESAMWWCALQCPFGVALGAATSLWQAIRGLRQSPSCLRGTVRCRCGVLKCLDASWDAAEALEQTALRAMSTWRNDPYPRRITIMA